MRKIFLSILCLALLPLAIMAQVTLPKVIGDNMVLQQGKKVNIWGEAAPGEQVTVRFQRQTKKAVADAEGKWSVQLDEMTPTHKPQQMTIRGKKSTIRLKNILIGEVWLASGQSNMEYSMNNHPKYAKAKKGNPNAEPRVVGPDVGRRIFLRQKAGGRVGRARGHYLNLMGRHTH